MTERMREAPEVCAERARILDDGHRLRRPAEFVLALLGGLFYLALFYATVSLALYLVTGFLSVGQPFTEAQVADAAARSVGASEGAGGVGLRLAAALLLLAGPILVKAYRTGRRRLTGARLWRRTELAGLLCRWVGVTLAVVVFGLVLAATGWPFATLALIVVVFLLAFVLANGLAEALLERI